MTLEDRLPKDPVEIIDPLKVSNFKPEKVVKELKDEEGNVIDVEEKETITVRKYAYYVSFTCTRSSEEKDHMPDLRGALVIELDNPIKTKLDINKLRVIIKGNIEKRYNKDKALTLGDPFIIAFSSMGIRDITMVIEKEEEKEE